MTDDELLAKIAARVAASGAELPPPASLELVRAAERELGFALPSFYVRLLTEVANGGFGPGSGVAPGSAES